MLFAEAETAATRQKLGVGGRLSAGIAAAHMGFNGFHRIVYPSDQRSIIAGNPAGPPRN